MRPPQFGSESVRRRIPLPSVGQHLREFASNPHAWAVLGRNLIPVIGIYAFGWSAALTVFNYWFDGLTALAAIIAALVPRALRETQTKKQSTSPLPVKIVRGVVTWLFLIAFVGIPYWIVLIPLQPLFSAGALTGELAQRPGVWLTFAAMAASHFWKAFQFGYDVIPDNQLKQRVRWDVYLLMLRAIAMFMMIAHGLYFIIVPLMALLLTYFEIWPERVLGGLVGDPSKLWQYDPGNDPS